MSYKCHSSHVTNCAFAFEVRLSCVTSVPFDVCSYMIDRGHLCDILTDPSRFDFYFSPLQNDYVFTTGGNDRCVMQWKTNLLVDAVESEVSDIEEEEVVEEDPEVVVAEAEDELSDSDAEVEREAKKVSPLVKVGCEPLLL